MRSFALLQSHNLWMETLRMLRKCKETLLCSKITMLFTRVLFSDSAQSYSVKGITFHLQLVLLSYHPIFLRPYQGFFCVGTRGYRYCVPGYENDESIVCMSVLY